MTIGFQYACILQERGLGSLYFPPLLLSGCASLGLAMPPYSEAFSCKNRDHGQWIRPEKVYEDASQGIRSRSHPEVTHDNAISGMAPASFGDGASRRGRCMYCGDQTIKACGSDWRDYLQAKIRTRAKQHQSALKCIRYAAQ